MLCDSQSTKPSSSRVGTRLFGLSLRYSGVSTMPFEKQMAKIDRPFYERLRALDEPTLQERLGKWVNGRDWLRAILKRRDRIVKLFEQQAKERGEDAVFIP